jgi:hypothetical protein
MVTFDELTDSHRATPLLFFVDVDHEEMNSFIDIDRFSGESHT